MTETPSPGPDPEQLLKMLDMEIALRRGNRKHSESSSLNKRVLVLVVGLVVLVGAVTVAFLFLQYAASELPRAGASGTEPGRPGNAKNF